MTIRAIVFAIFIFILEALEPHHSAFAEVFQVPGDIICNADLTPLSHEEGEFKNALDKFVDKNVALLFVANPTPEVSSLLVFWYLSDVKGVEDVRNALETETLFFLGKPNIFGMAKGLIRKAAQRTLATAKDRLFKLDPEARPEAVTDEPSDSSLKVLEELGSKQTHLLQEAFNFFGDDTQVRINLIPAITHRYLALNADAIKKTEEEYKKAKEEEEVNDLTRMFGNLPEPFQSPLDFSGLPKPARAMQTLDVLGILEEFRKGIGTLNNPIDVTRFNENAIKVGEVFVKAGWKMADNGSQGFSIVNVSDVIDKKIIYFHAGQHLFHVDGFFGEIYYGIPRFVEEFEGTPELAIYNLETHSDTLVELPFNKILKGITLIAPVGPR